MDVTVAEAFEHYILVTDDAIVRVERRSEEERRRLSTIVFVVGGIVGPVLAALADRVGVPGGPTKLYLRPHGPPPLAEMMEVKTWWASDVPAELSALQAWPRVEGFRPVTFFPRRMIARVQISRWRGLVMTLEREVAREIALPLPAWHHRKIQRHLTRAGYPLVS